MIPHVPNHGIIVPNHESIVPDVEVGASWTVPGRRLDGFRTVQDGSENSTLHIVKKPVGSLGVGII